jgi:hypothetical protein
MSFLPVAGSAIKFYTAASDVFGAAPAPFVDFAGAAVDPDVVTFQYWIENTLQGTFTYTHGATPPDPTYTIVRDGTGLYHAVIASYGLPGKWTWAWDGQPGVSGLDTTKTAAATKGTFIVDRLGP